MVVGVGGRSSFISPCSSGTWIDLRRDWSLQGFSVLALEHQGGFVSGFDLTVKDKHCWFGCMLQRYRRARKWAWGTFIYCLIMLGGPGEASRELLPMIKEWPAEKRGHPEDFLLIMQIHRSVSASLSDANLKQKLTGLHVCRGHREEPSPTLPGGIIQGMPNPSWERGRRDIASGES